MGTGDALGVDRAEERVGVDGVDVALSEADSSSVDDDSSADEFPALGDAGTGSMRCSSTAILAPPSWRGNLVYSGTPSVPSLEGNNHVFHEPLARTFSFFVSTSSTSESATAASMNSIEKHMERTRGNPKSISHGM